MSLTDYNNPKPLKVSDWSQKYKLVIYGVSGALLTYIGFRIINLLEQINSKI